MNSLLVWWYDGRQLGPFFSFADSTPNTITDTVEDIMFTVTLISNDNGSFVSSVSFIADTATNGMFFTCIGSDINREIEIIQAGSGMNYQPCTCS